MSSQRTLQMAARRLAMKPTTSLTTSRFASPIASLLQLRNASVDVKGAKSMRNEDAMEILVRQRLNRPVAPHLTIYKPQVTWILSGLNRLTGVIGSGSLYLFGLAYLAAPMFGWQFTSAGMAAAFGAWPVFAKFLVKLIAATPVAFHSFNGLRHLTWDTGSQLSNQQVIRTGWAVVGLTFVSAFSFAAFF